MGEEGVSPRQRLAQAKQKIKVWEGEYRAHYGSPPDREAMAQAPEDIRHAYKTYRYYRKAVMEQSTASREHRKSMDGNKDLKSTTTCDTEEGRLSKRLLRHSSSGDMSTRVSVSCAENLVTSEHSSFSEDSTRDGVVDVGGIRNCDSNMGLTSDVNASGAQEMKTKSISESVSEKTNHTTSVTPGSGSLSGMAGASASVTKFADTSLSTKTSPMSERDSEAKNSTTTATLGSSSPPRTINPATVANTSLSTSGKLLDTGKQHPTVAPGSTSPLGTTNPAPATAKYADTSFNTSGKHQSKGNQPLTATPGSTSPPGTTNSAPATAKFANTSVSTWGKHLNKGNQRPKEAKKDTSLYTKMAEKLRAKSTIKMRRSLSRTSSMSKPQDKPLFGALSRQNSRTSISSEGTEASSDSKDSCSKSKLRGEEASQDDSRDSTSDSRLGIDASSINSVNELLPLSAFEAMEAGFNEELDPFSEDNEESIRPRSIFKAMEARHKEESDPFSEEKEESTRPISGFDTKEARYNEESDPFSEDREASARPRRVFDAKETKYSEESDPFSEDQEDSARPRKIFEAMEARHKEDSDPFSEVQEPTRPGSIFEAMESKSLETLREKNLVNTPKSLPNLLDTLESDTFEKTPKYQEVSSSQKAPVVQPISVLSTLGQTHTSGLLGIKKRAPLNLAWVERCTGLSLEGNAVSKQNMAQDGWKMKLIDKEWSEEAEKKEAIEEQHPAIEDPYNDALLFSTTKKASESKKAVESSSVTSVNPLRTNVSTGNVTSRKSTNKAASNANVKASKPTKRNARQPVQATKRKPVRKTTTTATKKAQMTEDASLPAPSNTGRVLRTRSARNIPKPDYAEGSDGEDYDTGEQKRRIADDDEEWQEFGDSEQQEDQGQEDYDIRGQKRRITDDDDEWHDFGDTEQLGDQDQDQDQGEIYEFVDEEADDYEAEPAISEACMRKRRKVETLEELEEQGKIQCQWPPPKKKRVARKKAAPRRRPRKVVGKENSPKVKRQVRKRRAVRYEEEAGAEMEEQSMEFDKENSPKLKRQTRKRRTVQHEEEEGEEAGAEEQGLVVGSSAYPPVPSMKYSKKNSPKVKRQVRKRRPVIHEEEDEIEVEEQGLVVGTSTQPQAPSIDYDETHDIESHGTKTTNTKGRYLTGKERLMKKVSTGSLNNNFVRINLKKKIYVRGKKTMNSGKYKRQEWKKKQLMKGAEAGNAAAVKNLTCFKCGDFGHWAKSCPGKRGDKLTPLEEYDEKESTFLSLEEAASMALGIKKTQSGPSLSKLYPKASGAETGDETTAFSNTNTETLVDNCITQEAPDETGNTEAKGTAPANSQTQAVPDRLQDGENGTTNTQDQATGSQDAASLAENDFMDADDDDVFGNLDEADFQEQEQPLPSSSQESLSSTGHLGSSQTFSTSNLAETDFPEQQDGPGSSQETINSSGHLGSSQTFSSSNLAETEPSSSQETVASIGHFSNSQSSQSFSNPWEERPTVEPLYPLSDGEVQSTPEEVHDALRKFGYPSFRPGQEEAIMRILSGQSTLLVLSTGSGKSLCYQLPAYLYAKHRSPCITLCVSPLVSLMEDQVVGLPRFLKAVCLHTHQNQSQRSQALTAIHSRAAHILLVSPEAVVASRAGGVLGTLLKELPPVAFACLDEAHCVSEWSHNFRPSYLRVCQVLRERLGVKTILGLTATARHATALSIARHLLIDDFDTGVIRGTSVPDNLQLSVSRDRNREEALVSLLQGERFSGCSSIIIYCTRRDECERVATLIRTQLLDPSKIDVKSNLKRNRGLSFDAEAYHAGLSSHRRNQVQKRFMSGKLRIVVATVAFGMGIDKSDVRGIIHFNMPRNVESYVQEIGRAGRDGEEAHCHLFLDDQDGRDIQELKRHIFANSIDRHTIRKLLNKIFKPCTCAKLKSLSSGAEETGNDSTLDIPASPVRSSQVSQDIAAENTGTAADPFTVPTTPSCCPRHEVAVPIEAVVEELDLPEENLETLLCYLELHQGNLIKINSHVYANCSVSCYAGPRQLVAVSRRCPPLAVAIALERQKGKDFTSSNSVSFAVVELASRMGWNSKIVKRELKSLEWNTQGLNTGGNVKRSGVVVEMTDLSFHLEARGDLSDDERDRVLDAVYRRTKVQEQDQLRQLHYTYQLLRSVSHSTILFCCDSVDQERCDRLRTELREYFRSDGALSEVQVEEKGSVKPEVECGIRSSVRAFLSTYNDQQWTGRAVARVFHGIGSPNYPTEVWGRVRRYWRQHLNADFNVLVKIATQEILRCK